MKPIIITLIVSSIQFLNASTLIISPQPEFQEVDPILLKQPAKRIFLPKDQAYSGCSISLHEEKVEESPDLFFSKTKQFIESTFPMTFEAFKTGATKMGYPVIFYRLKPFKKKFDVESLHAYIFHQHHLYLLSYSAPSAIFNANLSIFQKFLDALKISNHPFISLEEEKNFKELIKKEKISILDFLNSKSVHALLKKARLNLQHEDFINALFEIRTFLYSQTSD